jgi:hypothetical protein
MERRINMPGKKKQSRRELFDGLLENIDKQIETDTKLKELMEALKTIITNSSKSQSISDKVLEIRDLYVEAEILQAEGRAIFHQLFGTGFER